MKENVLDYTIPVFYGSYTTKPKLTKKPLTLVHVDDESGVIQRDKDEELAEADSSTTRMRRYNRKNRKKVRQYLKKTQDDRVARNRDRRKAVKKHGKKKMKNHDVHHPNGPHNGGARLTRKDHGRDKVNEVFQQLRENFDIEQVHKFVKYVSPRLKLKTIPTINIIEPQPDMTSLGHYAPDNNVIGVIVKGRLLADVLRTLAHELVHHKQKEMGYLKNPAYDGKTGSPIENKANVIAGILLRDYGKINTNIFLNEGLLMEGEEGKDYILCKECQQKFVQIQYRHLKCKHNMTVDEYVKKHPSAKLIAENAKNYMGTGKNPMENTESRQKISNALAGTHKCAHFGDDNGMKQLEVRAKFMGDKNPAKTEYNRKKISEGVKNSYTEELKKIRSTAFKETRNSDEFRERMYELKLWTRPEDKPSRELYGSVVRKLSNINYQEYFSEIPNAKKRSREWHLDHKISIQHGFDNQIHPAIISHPCNLEIVHHSLNESKGIKNSLLYEELLQRIGRFDELHGERVLLVCGGAAGHLAHPFEDEELTFADMKEMINRGLIGGLDQEAPVTEKLDGQNIAFSVRDGQIVFARNKGHVKSRGKNALDVAGIRQMFAGRGGIEKAFTGAAEDLQAAVEKLSPEQIQQMFGDGSRFMSLEVILPDTQNVIPYGKSVLVMHGSIEYDEEGNEIGRSTTDGKEFADALTAVGAEQQKTFGISGPRTIAFSEDEAEKYEQRAGQYAETLDRAVASFELDENATLAEYRQAWWAQEIQKEMERTGINLSEEEFDGIIRRWADGDKKFGVKDIQDPETKKWFRDYEKNSLQSAQKKMIRPIETVFLRAGADSLRRVTNFLSANNPVAATQLKQDVLDAIKAIQDSNQPDKIAKLQKELERLEAIGMDKVVPSEGVVFIYNGKPYKFTGTFAPINQITGTFKFGMAPKETEEPKKSEEPTKPSSKKTPKSQTQLQPTQPEKTQSSTTEPKPATPPRTAAIFTGRFQPFHAGHYSIYQGLVDRFGKENVYIASSNVTDPVKSPFEFKEKKNIMTKMFDIPEDMVVQVKNPYRPLEILDKLPPETRYVTAMSQKDAERLGGSKYFRNFDDVPEEKLKGYKDQGYFIVAPEMQLNIDGKNISGTALRAAFGDPRITDRAKQEIFTKVYGKFDPKIFKKIVGITTGAEEARKLTDMHGEPEEPTAEPTQKKSRKVKKKPDEKALGRARSVLGKKVRNPKTGRDILVATALKYAETEPVRRAAEKIIQTAMQQNENLLMEEQLPQKLKVYPHVRKYTEKDLENEVDEYFKNERTLEAFPEMADSAEELRQLILDAPSEVLEINELNDLLNSDVPDILNGKNKMDVLKRLIGNRRDVTGLLQDIKNEKPIAMPIVIKHTKGYYLLGGNTRLSVLAAIKHTMPVKVLGQKTPFPAPFASSSLEKRKTGSGKNAQGKNLFKKLLQMKITNPETGNEIKVDTAMDYDKTHAAHQSALSFIRQHMKGYSNRAGIPKDSGPKS